MAAESNEVYGYLQPAGINSEFFEVPAKFFEAYRYLH